MSAVKRSVDAFPVFAHCVENFIDDFDADPHGVRDHADLDPSTAPLSVRLEDFKRSVGTLRDILELDGLGPSLYDCYFVVCETVDRDASDIGRHWEAVSLPGCPFDETVSLIAIAAAHPGYARASLDRLSVLLHEIAHLRFPSHDVWFATMLNWQRQRCGLPYSTDPYDVRDETAQNGFTVSTRSKPAATALALARDMAAAFRTVDSMPLVATALNQLSCEYKATESGCSARDRAAELAATMSGPGA